uniref:hypothetical protein n=1 Tax=Sphaerisporangium sp. CA-236357 TaxID=3240030 RepID=UPI003F492A5B
MDPGRRYDRLVTVPSPEEVEAARTPAGGWTREQLAEWGVPWPPPKGWKATLAERWKTSDEHDEQ